MSNSRHIGTLIVVILKARNLPNKRHIGKQDPFCQVIFNGEKRRTKAIKRGGQHPEWDEEIRFELFEDTDELPHVPGADPPPPPPKSNGKGPPKVKGGNHLALSCYADDPREPDLIGESKVDLTEVLTKGETDEWFTIMHKEKYCGEVYLELTFWLDEPPPTKKTNPKPTNGQYGGRGTFVPIGDSTSSSLTDLSRVGSTGSRDDIRRENLPPSLRSSNSRLDIYVAPYETTRSHNSSVDGVMNDFAELRVDQGNRRQSMPTQSASYLPRPTSAMAAPPEQSLYPQHSHHQSTYSDGGGYPYDYGASQTPQPYHHDSAPLPDPYQPPYEQAATPAPSNFQGHGRPRYSLPPMSSGFMPLPQPSGFVPLSSNPPQPSGFVPQPAPTPAPGGYGGTIVPARVPSSSFSTLPPPPVAPSGFIPQGPSPSSSYPQLAQSPSHYYPPPQNQPPPTSYSQHTPPPPPSTYPSTPPTSSYSSNSLPTSSFPQQPPPPLPSSAPPAAQQPYPHSPSTPAISYHANSAPPEQPPYSNHATSSPSHDPIPPPPPLTHSPSNGHTGSRPLPTPGQPSSQYSHHSRRQSSLPVPPGPPPPGAQGFYSDAQNGTSFPTAIPYQSIPPPPPLPQQPPQSSFSNGQLAVPGPPPPLPPSSSSSSSLQHPAHAPPKRRPSLPPPPVTYQQQQSAFQALPPPPPPPSLPSHLQYEPAASSFMPAPQGQAYYPGPPPRPPQFLPPIPHQQTNVGYAPQGGEYYGQ
ncbi:hypothetical protein L226DRAFT_613288 [Lentinus tigrinus ALCF2SS1-7]|uniref:C2 domain-containing protein n=1 Tax=Lentinus tigrinus ALCF2SS1-6 TaxID=1328759 RepID=A0A5C2SDQ9_9APHY|nr:hypothetical protein L227DRAFT_573815 [Lentinus tigrinus ALCF2SS1-6]RPD74440.1 hypothetical protein L226DRAFT_613288 [Lentinus tigrinus ALCF2SS1-7]